jgi:hypothetical protein
MTRVAWNMFSTQCVKLFVENIKKGVALWHLAIVR